MANHLKREKQTIGEAMEQANLTRPLFESDREKDAFIVRLLVHHLFSPDDIDWLARFREFNLDDDEARALVVVREIGAIDNSVYRSLNRVDTLMASAHLRRLRDAGLLTQKGKGPATYYILAETLSSDAAGNPAVRDRTPADKETESSQTVGFQALAAGLGDLPAGLRQELEGMGKRSTPEQLRHAIVRLCAWRAMRPSDLAKCLRRTQPHLLEKHLRPMVREGVLEYVYPDNPAHPKQAYRAVDTARRE